MLEGRVSVYRTTARNFSASAENRIHSDVVAAQFGFEGALVPGAAVFGYMTHPLVDTLGPDWLSGWQVSVRFAKPAYDGDSLDVSHHVESDTHTVQCRARDILLAELHTRPLAPDEEPTAVDSGAAVGERPEIAWNNVNVGEPFPAWKWSPDAIENAEFAAQVEDDLPCYRTGVLHPHVILSTANRTFIRRYVLPAWIHVGSVLRFRRLLRVGDEIEVRTVPTRKWRRKGHEFVDLGIAYVVDGEVATEIEHTSIFCIASAPQAAPSASPAARSRNA